MVIEWSLFASKQLNAVLDYVENEYGAFTAKKVMDKIDASVSNLLKNQTRGVLDEDLSDSQFHVRHLQVFPNLIYYVVKDDVIIIAAVMHYRQSPKTVYKAIMRSLERYR